ncbi:DEAD/DEAH box helicase [Streptomyces sp. NPDC052693]|uniref:DEAD/DEAH box helicase n=1 Tax=Streptomyces sp. NPDC052693 TaxID=3155814 RepID=UPI003414DDB4
MNRRRTNDRFGRTRDGSADSGKGGSRFGSSAPRRSAGPSHSGGYGPRLAAIQGEFALPRTITPALPTVENSADLGMPGELLTALGSAGVTAPFPIQAATLPNTLANRDALGRGRTGSGKTLAFGLALLAHTAGRRAEPQQPLGLILVPTRELAQQVTDALTPYARSVKLRLATVVDRMSIGRQASALRGGAEVVVATPGRLKDLIDRGDCRLDQVSITVLDEADQMADMGFMPQVTALLDQVRPGGQRMLFSATLDRNVDLLVRRYLTDPVVHSVDPSAGAVTTMEHHVLHVHGADKHAVTTEIAARNGRVIMFLDTKHAVDKVTQHLLNSGARAAALHGGKSQPQHTRTLAHFKTGHVTVLVTTNVAARGIHVDNLDLVVNVAPPTDHKDHLHRGGRTARAAESGSVVTLVPPNQRRSMVRLMSDAGIRPQTTQAHSGDEPLHRITGAQAPTGIPVVITAPVAGRSKKGGTSSRSRRPASATRRAPAPQSATGAAA